MILIILWHNYLNNSRYFNLWKFIYKKSMEIYTTEKGLIHEFCTKKQDNRKRLASLVLGEKKQ